MKFKVGDVVRVKKGSWHVPKNNKVTIDLIDHVGDLRLRGCPSWPFGFYCRPENAEIHSEQLIKSYLGVE